MGATWGGLGVANAGDDSAVAPVRAGEGVSLPVAAASPPVSVAMLVANLNLLPAIGANRSEVMDSTFGRESVLLLETVFTTHTADVRQSVGLICHL